ncbi:Protein of unknown function [Pyronema omphalodes CBS 100304]|uniref:Uncharacterized protein n=1 Tax=Pyronema omphalodes (strain CBS 100304) TaxID=1076935 RepID=U4L9M5_PYROM|nr:Protein of unknown function [Pyronema omphalodes CBS 100304]
MIILPVFSHLLPFSGFPKEQGFFTGADRIMPRLYIASFSIPFILYAFFSTHLAIGLSYTSSTFSPAPEISTAHRLTHFPTQKLIIIVHPPTFIFLSINFPVFFYIF